MPAIDDWNRYSRMFFCLFQGDFVPDDCLCICGEHLGIGWSQVDEFSVNAVEHGALGLVKPLVGISVPT